MITCDNPTCPTTGQPKSYFDAGLLAGPIPVCLTCEYEQQKYLQRKIRLETFPYQDIRRAPLLPFLHQFDGTQRIVESDYLFLADEPRVAKSKQIIDAAQILHSQGKVNRVIVIAPGPAVRSVWWHAEFGEIRRHSWPGNPVVVTEFHNPRRQWKVEGDNPLRWVVTNYEFLRYRREGSKDYEKVLELLPYCGRSTLMVCDESIALADIKTDQWRSINLLRKKCGRIILLNGTPFDTLIDLLGQANMLSRTILACPSKTQFRARYAIQEVVKGAGGRALTDKWGNVIKRDVGWRNEDEVMQKLAPYTLRRLKADCLDLPPKLPPVALTFNLSPATWRLYCDMRDEAIAWLGKSASMSPQAATKVIRLQQIISGFLGGVEELDLEHLDKPRSAEKVEREIGSEALDFFLEWIAERIKKTPSLKFVVWSRHRHEILRWQKALSELMPCGMLIGGQKDAEREYAKQLLDPRSAPRGPAGVVGQAGVGGKGLTMAAASEVYYASNWWSLILRQQSEDRPHGPEQRNAVAYFDLLACGPRGQRTIAWDVMAALARKEDLSERTCSGWVQALRDEWEHDARMGL